MTTIYEKHWTEQRQCSHDRLVWALLPVARGAMQVRRACADCGHRTGSAAPHADHPDARTYPAIEVHPSPCECHASRRETRSVVAGEYSDYLASDAWRSKRTYYLGRAMHRCQLCNKPGGPGGKGLEVHHRTYERVGQEIDADVIVLCGDCHGRHHGHIAEHRAA